MRTGLWVVLAGLAACHHKDDGTSDSGAPTDTDTAPPTTTSTGDTRRDTILGLTGVPANGQPLYDHDCAQCHLEDGSGGGPFPALTDRVPVLTDERMIEVQLNGIPASSPGNVPMPEYADIYTNQQHADVLAYIKSAFGS